MGGSDYHAKVAISDRFMLSMAGLPKQTAKKTIEFVSKFRKNPKSPGINYETINDARDKQYRSVRIDQNYRGIIRAPDNGDVYLLLWVDKHDDAYSWARRHKCDVHPGTGTLQIYESVETELEVGHYPAVAHEDDIMQRDFSPESAGTPKERRKLLSLTETQLNAIGVPRELMRDVRKLESEHELESLESRLPVEAFEALYLVAAGASWEEIEADYINSREKIIDTTDFELALSRGSSQRSFYVIGDEIELQQMLDAPLDRWRVFLHPSQRKLVERSWNGPVRVLGGAGTGKTVVAIHRARWLARNIPEAEGKILVTTFTANLALDIEANLRKICSVEEMDRIEVKNIDAWVSAFLKEHEYPSEIVYSNNRKLEAIWRRALIDNDEFPESFFKEEWERIVLPQRIESIESYRGAVRTGRGVPLTRKQRLNIWKVFERVRTEMREAQLKTFEDATLDAADLVTTKMIKLPYRAVVVDETQDMGPQALTLLRSIVSEQENDMLLVGDGHQRIYRRHAVMSHCGIKIIGRSRKLKINYRTTEETRRFATAILEGVVVDDMDGGTDTETDYRSLTHGEQPVLKGFNARAAESAEIVEIVRELIRSGVESSDICVSYRTNRLGEYYGSQLRAAGVQTRVIMRNAADTRAAGVRLASMHRIKGLEFRYVILAGVGDGQLPLPISHSSTDDPVEMRLHEIAERSLLHVAATRAINKLYVTWFGSPSVFLKDLV